MTPKPKKVNPRVPAQIDIKASKVQAILRPAAIYETAMNDIATHIVL
ncbi:hypothetical protein Hanom_Chr01g00056511 [Helianthus anomalus]